MLLMVLHWVTIKTSQQPQESLKRYSKMTANPTGSLQSQKVPFHEQSVPKKLKVSPRILIHSLKEKKKKPKTNRIRKFLKKSSFNDAPTNENVISATSL